MCSFILPNTSVNSLKIFTEYIHWIICQMSKSQTPGLWRRLIKKELDIMRFTHLHIFYVLTLVIQLMKCRNLFEVSLNSSHSIQLIELIWKTMIGSLEWTFLLPILFLLYIVSLLPVTVNKLFKKLHILNNYIDVCLPWTVTFYLQLILVSQGNFFLMIGSLEVMHEIISTILSVIQISSINSIRVRFNLGKPRLHVNRYITR